MSVIRSSGSRCRGGCSRRVARTWSVVSQSVLLMLVSGTSAIAQEAPAFDTTASPFLLDEDVIPDTLVPLEPRFQHASHGRFITRSRSGHWFCAFLSNRQGRDRNSLFLAISESPRVQGHQFATPIPLAGTSRPGSSALFNYEGDFIRNACLMMDQRDTLHLFFDDSRGVHHLTADADKPKARERLAERSAWQSHTLVAGPGSLLWDAAPLASGEIAVYYSLAGTFYERPLTAKAQPICEAGLRAVVHVDQSGTRHLAFEKDHQIYYIHSSDTGKWTSSRGSSEPELVAYYYSSFPSIAVTPDGTVVIAYQGEGKVALKYETRPYSLLRRSGGTTVSYAVLNDGVWKAHDFQRSREILLKRYHYTGARRRTSDVEFKPFMEEFWRPSLAVDKHGVIWMFFPNTTRRHTYFTRFLGETFGDHFEARGPYDDLSRVLLVQKDCRGQRAIGTLTVASSQVYFDTHEVPQYSSDEARRVVFLDNLELVEMIGVDHEIGHWKKHPTALCGAGVPGGFMDEFISVCEVSKTADGFEMRYQAQLPPLRMNFMPGRGFSEDGICWQKRPPFDHSQWTLDGKSFPNTFWRPIFLEDPDEPDSNRRFKGLLGNWRVVDGVEVRAWDVVTSPDGVAWRTVPDLPIAVTGDISWNYHLKRDEEDQDPNRRFKVAMQVNTDSGRAVAVFTSPNLIHWSRAYRFREEPNVLTSAVWRQPTGPVAIHPDAAESPWEEEVHDASIWRENGLLVFHYDAFKFDGNQHVDKALTVSRDGKHYHRIKRGAVNLPHGNAGQWDNGRIRTGVPIRVGDELWLYYCGMPAQTHHDIPHTADDLHTQQRATAETLRKGRGLSRGDHLRPQRLGLARLRADGWAYLQLTREAPAGYVTTIPLEYVGGDLVVNGIGLGPGSLSVEILAADTMEVIEGFSCNDAAFSHSDSVSSHVTWKNGKALPRGTYRLRFVFRSLKSKLYAFGFESGSSS